MKQTDHTDNSSNHSRRRLLQVAGLATSPVLAGCLGGGGGSSGTEDENENETGTQSEPSSNNGSGSDSASGVERELFGAAADVELGEEGELQVIEGDIDNVLTGIEVVDHVGVLASFPDRVTLTVSARIRNTGSEAVNLFDYSGANLVSFDSDGNQVSEDRSGVSNQSGDGTPPGETFVVDLYGGDVQGENVSRYEIEINCEMVSEDLAYCPEN